MGSVLLIFIDGLGLAPSDSPCNPLARFVPSVLNCFSDRRGPVFHDGLCLPTDASLGVPGTPQSATGQTTIFTGVNAAALLGHHSPGYPRGPLARLIREDSLPRRLVGRGLRVGFLNTYTPGYLANRPRWVSVTTLVSETAGLRLNMLEDLRAGRSLYMDFTNRLLRERGYEAPLLTPSEAGQLLAAQATRYDFSFYEYFLTDLAGHRGTPERNAEILRQLDEFLHAAAANLDLSRMSLIITSDHGNVEDSCVAGHTLNRVPTLLWGPIQDLVAETELSLTQLAPLIESCVSGDTYRWPPAARLRSPERI